MKKIIDNPNPTKEFVLTCDKCQCKFSFNVDDTYRMGRMFGSMFGESIFAPVVTSCPNCGHELLVGEL